MTQNDKTYNGWTNYETWVTALWLDNDEGSQNYWREIAQECRDQAPSSSRVKEGYVTVEGETRYTLAERLKEEITDASPLPDAGLFTDLLGAALQEVNWYEIVDHWLADLSDA